MWINVCIFVVELQSLKYNKDVREAPENNRQE